MFVNFFQIFISILILGTIEGIRQNITGGSFIKNKYSYSPVILAFDNVGPLMCIKNCLLHKGCKAVNFNGSQFECELLNVTFPYDMLTDIKGSFYTEIDGWTKDKDGCTPNPCEVGQRCVPAMYNNYICLKIDAPCDVNLCQHKYGVCRNKVNGYRCICQEGYYMAIIVSIHALMLTATLDIVPFLNPVGNAIALALFMELPVNLLIHVMEAISATTDTVFIMETSMAVPAITVGVMIVYHCARVNCASRQSAHHQYQDSMDEFSDGV